MQVQTNNPLYGKLKSLLMLPLIASLLFFFGSKQAEAKLNFELEEHTVLFSEAESINDSLEQEEARIMDVVEDQPIFPGGEVARMEFLKNNIKYPDDARKGNVEGTVYVSFIVRKDGSLTDAKILRGVSPSLDAEVLRIVSAMPRWIPGKQRGKAVNVKYNMPVRFSLTSTPPPPPPLPTEKEYESRSKAQQ